MRSQFQKGLYLTYEELKQNSNRNSESKVSACLYLTYEELKQLSFERKTYGKEGLYLTYEELKRHTNCLTSSTIYVYILPMRN